MVRLLLVDDNPSIHLIVSSLLKEYRVSLTYADNLEAIQRLLDNGRTFDLVLLDIGLSKESECIEVHRVLKSVDAHQNVPIYLMAGPTESYDAIAISGLCAQGILKKPVELKNLISIFSRHIRIEKDDFQTTKPWWKFWSA